MSRLSSTATRRFPTPSTSSRPASETLSATSLVSPFKRISTCEDDSPGSAALQPREPNGSRARAPPKLRSRCRNGIDATTPGPSPSVKARAVCTIDLDALARNLAEIRRLVGASVRICAVVKADAYGHGAVPVSRALVAAGVDHLAVACLDEALELRGAGISSPILVFGGIAAAEGARG